MDEKRIDKKRIKKKYHIKNAPVNTIEKMKWEREELVVRDEKTENKKKNHNITYKRHTYSHTDKTTGIR